MSILPLDNVARRKYRVGQMKLKPNRGSELLRELLPERGQAEFARKIGAKPSMVSRWKNDQARPSLKYRQIMLKELGIGLFSWEQPPKRRLRRAA